MPSPFSNLATLPTISYCGMNFGHSKWFSHLGVCPLCKKEWKATKDNAVQAAKKEWNHKCDCGCGLNTSYGKSFYKGHHLITEEFKEKKRQDCLKNPLMDYPEARKKLSLFWKGRPREKQRGEYNSAKKEEVRLKISKNNPMRNPEYRDTQKKACNTDKERTRRSKVMSEKNPAKVKEYLEKRIDTYTRKLAAGEYHNRNNWKTGWFSKKDGTKEWFDSSYEEKAMEAFEKEGVTWTKKHGIRIPFVSLEGINTFYIPDFLVIREGVTSLEEVKGWLSQSVIDKAQIAIAFCEERGYLYKLLLGPNLTLYHKLSSPACTGI